MASGQEDRLQLWLKNRAAAQVAVSKVSPEAMMTSAVVVADTRDRVGKLLAEAMATVHGMDLAKHEQEVLKQGQIPTAILILPRDILQEVLAPECPGVAEAIGRLPP
jgi:hypothetical protein